MRLLSFLCLVAFSTSQEIRPAVELVRSGSLLANLPLEVDPEASALTQSGFVVDNPKRGDLAVSRLQDNIRQVVGQLWENVLDGQRFAILKEKGAVEEVVKSFSESLRNDVFALENQVEASKVESILQQMKIEGNREESNDWKETLQNFQKITGKINLLYGYLDGYFSNPSDATPIVLEDYARSILQPGSTQDRSVITSLVNLHQLSVPTSDVHDAAENELHDGRRGRSGLLGGQKGTQRNDLFYRLYRILRNPDSASLCEMGQSPQQLLFNLYNLLALTEVKGYAMLQFSYLILRLSNRGNYTLESDLANKSFDVQTTEKLTEIKNVLARIPRDIWACDPDRQIEGTTFVQMTQLLQGHMENEVDMNSLQSCKDSCSSYKVAEEHSCFKNLFCAKQQSCDGRLFDCTFYNADSWVCMSTQGNRKYDWIEYEDGTILGNKNQCNNKIKVDSWWRWVFWHCSYCLCKCDAPGPNSDRYWSLRPVLADVSSNKIITGARFVKKDRVIQFEIEEATALPEGVIDENSRKWAPAPSMNSTETAALKSDSTIFSMSYEQRALDMDRLEAPTGHVVTGIRLRSLGGHLNLEIQATPISFSTGKLLSDRSTWIGNDNTPATIEPRQMVSILSPDIPTKFAGKSKLDTGHNQYIVFDATSAAKDVMQTTVPFIDSQSVSPQPGTWISGAGLYHKGEIGYGGYVGLMLKTFDVSRHLVLKKDSSVAYRQARKNL